MDSISTPNSRASTQTNMPLSTCARRLDDYRVMYVYGQWRMQGDMLESIKVYW